MIFREPFPSCAYTRIFRIHACCIARHTRARVNGKKKNQKNTPDETLEARLREFANLRFRKTFYANTALDGVMFKNENATTRIRIIRSRDRLQTYPTGRVSFASPKTSDRTKVTLPVLFDVSAAAAERIAFPPNAENRYSKQTRSDPDRYRKRARRLDARRPRPTRDRSTGVSKGRADRVHRAGVGGKSDPRYAYAYFVRRLPTVRSRRFARKKRVCGGRDGLLHEFVSARASLGHARARPEIFRPRPTRVGTHQSFTA